MPTSRLAAVSLLPEVIEIERTLTRIAYLADRTRQHDRLMTKAGVPLDRAAVALLRQIAASGAPRPGELANRLGVEASHVSRQVQHLQKAGYVTRVTDPADRRARRIRLTRSGRRAVDRVHRASRRGMGDSLADWSPEELCRLAVLFHRLVDDLLAQAEAEVGPHTGSDGRPV